MLWLAGGTSQAVNKSMDVSGLLALLLHRIAAHSALAAVERCTLSNGLGVPELWHLDSDHSHCWLGR